ncbi:MAG: prephenate/arogenate dehydrogenase family protein [Alphaproteobacteria bacterium]|nr:prephenate/arogenate dehydrogenase family protein [Alphaproteobacteria bacterium]MCZ6844783.1 prephenate/arogenate dehydrogenase family protein [Alphaproteobacteria bacterium]
MTDTPLFERVTIIGIGLIGSSLARALKAGGLAGHVAAHDIDAGVRATAEKLGFADSVHAALDEAVAGSDLVVLAVPVGVYRATATAMSPHLAAGAIVTDVGSVKAEVFRAVKPVLPAGVHLVPGHPVAGTEHSGPEAGFADLFRDRWAILTPEKGTDEKAVARVAEMWRQVGSDVEIMEASHHDRVLAITSHLPHLIAYTIVATAADLESQLQGERKGDDVVTTAEVIKYSAGGFRDFTRIAGSNPVMWRDVFLTNKEAVLEMLGRFSEDLTALQRAIRWEDGDQLEQLFTRTRDIRRGVVEARQAGRFQYTENGDDEAKE